MATARWERVKEVFEAAVDLAEPERSAYLAETCQGDESLRMEIDELLAGHEKAGSFLNPPNFFQEGDSTVPEDKKVLASPILPLTFSADQIVSRRFKVVRFIGRGGMGEVYEARDLDLGVRVALKTVRPEIASDPRTLLRFKHEIQLARRVAHPNVCRMHDLERHQPLEGEEKAEIVFLTMELLEGETLADRLHRQGRMSCNEALPLVRQMVDGLESAHQARVVH
ncbi:MAG: serine/threonine-protein kinase, partial [Terriglobia bacterium]